MARGQTSAARPPPRGKKSESSRSASVDEKVQINLGDLGTVKHTVDATITQAVTDAGYAEDSTYTWIRLGLGVCAIACAGAAHLLPGKFPSNWWSLLACVVSYCVCSVAIWFFTLLWERDVMLFTQPKKEAPFCEVQVRTHMPRFSDQLSIAMLDTKSSCTVEKTTSVTHYFHSNGYHAAEPLRVVVRDMLKQLESKSAAVSGSRQ